MTALALIDADVSDYSVIYEMQLELVQKKRTGQVLFDYLILVEHPHVYTVGRKARDQWERVRTLLPGPVFLVERGGEITHHCPGQLVCYPILSLQEQEQDLHRYLRELEATLIDTLREFGIRGESRREATGVWISGKEKKIASIGVAVTSWITYHGVALNVINDLSRFKAIHPCGFSSEVMTSMKEELGEKCPTMEEVKSCFLSQFSHRFQRTLLS